MKKVLRGEILLNENEYDNISDYFDRELKHCNFHKNINISDGNNTYKLNIQIFDDINESYYDAVTVLIKDISSYGKLGINLCFEETYYNIHEIIGIKKAIMRANDIEIDFYINFNQEYDGFSSSTKYDYYKRKLGNVEHKCIEGGIDEPIREIIYADFKNEKELALASYCFLASKLILLNGSNAHKLFIDKLNFVGYELEELIDLKQSYSKNDVTDYVNECKTAKQLLNFLLSYIAYIAIGKSTSKLSDDIENEIPHIAYEIYESYIALLTD